MGGNRPKLTVHALNEAKAVAQRNGFPLRRLELVPRLYHELREDFEKTMGLTLPERPTTEVLVAGVAITVRRPDPDDAPKLEDHIADTAEGYLGPWR